MKSKLTNFDLRILIIFIIVLLIDSTVALYAFYRNYNITGKITPYVSQYATSDKIRMHITDTLFVFSTFICIYFLYFKTGLSQFLVILLWLLLFKSVSHLILASRSYFYFTKPNSKTNKSNKAFENLTLADNIFGQILSLTMSIYILNKLFFVN